MVCDAACTGVDVERRIRWLFCWYVRTKGRTNARLAPCKASPHGSFRDGGERCGGLGLVGAVAAAWDLAH